MIRRATSRRLTRSVLASMASPRRVLIAGLALFCTAASNVALGEFIVQPAFWHSYIGTEDGRIKDTAFKTALEGVFDAPIGGAGNYDDLVIALGQCFGGGMLDDTAGFLTSAQTSATRWNELSWSTDVAAKNREGAYVKEWATAVDTVAKRNMEDAYIEANKKDLAGPVTKAYFTKWGPKYLEHPQYTSSSVIGDAIKLRDSVPAKAILFGGNDNVWDNFNSLSHIHDVLTTRYGYAEADLRILYPGAKKPDGTALPAWIDTRATTKDFNDAMTWLDGLTTAVSKPDVLYWNSQMHGDLAIDLKEFSDFIGDPLQPIFGLTSEFLSFYSEPDPTIISDKYLSLDYSGLSAGNELFLNSVSLGELPAGSSSFDITLDPGVVPLSLLSNTLEIVGPDTFDLFASIDLGVSALGIMPIPEPSTIALSISVMISLLACRRRRSK